MTGLNNNNNNITAALKLHIGWLNNRLLGSRDEYISLL
jgi:hypothetical protein